MFIVPDGVLEANSCDFCHKFLSVGPVKVYPNRRTKCGRCVQNGNAGVFSQYGLIVEQGMFKCVNRFDGCKKLLRFDQVADHEVNCRSKIHECPVCPETTGIPTFLLIKHFEEHHKDCILKTPSFRVEINTPVTKTYLYRVEDNLFFIEYNYDSVDSIGLKALFLGHQTEFGEITQIFKIYYGDDLVGQETETKKWAENFEGFKFLIPKIRNKFVLVVFRLDLKPEAASERTVEQKKTIGFPRSVVLSEDCDPKFSLDPCSISVIVQESERDQSRFFCHCYNCSESMELWGGESFIEIKPKVYHFICDPCEVYYKKQLPNMQIITKGQFLFGLNGYIGFSCIWRAWGCSVSDSSLYSISSHEMECAHQPFQPCPVPNCSYYGIICDIEKHSIAVHEEVHMMLPPNNYLYFPNTPIDTWSSFRYYFWASHSFVAIEVCVGKYFYKISLIQQDTELNTDKTKQRVVIFNDDEYFCLTADNNHNITLNKTTGKKWILQVWK